MMSTHKRKVFFWIVLCAVLFGILFFMLGGGSGSRIQGKQIAVQPFDPFGDAAIEKVLELPIVKKYPLDGVVDFSKLSSQTRRVWFEKQVNATDVTFAFDNDDKHLYFAVEWFDKTHNNKWFRSSVISYDEVRFLVDSNGNGVHDEGEDFKYLRATQSGSTFRDSHLNSSINGNDSRHVDIYHADRVGDGLARMKYHASLGKYQAEFIIPLQADKYGEDATISNRTKFQVVFIDNSTPVLGLASRAWLFGRSGWGPVPLTDAGSRVFDHPVIPSNLDGLVVFMSKHESLHGEVYVFNPRARNVTRITYNHMHENALSLSNDRTKVAFHGWRNRSNLSTMDIYVVNIDGSNLTQLTNDLYANAHPAWSPDDSRIIYSPIYYPNKTVKPGVSVMTSTGDFITHLTPPGVEDHDAEYVGGGLIAMKTDRWTAFPELRIGVMDENGSNVRQLSFGNNFSDHDPNIAVPRDQVIFERYRKAANFENDPDILTVPWDIVEVGLYNQSERVILSDGWLNALPVYDPSGQYIAYTRGPQYEEVVLMTRSGEVLGRFIPDITQIEYIDWK